MYGHLGRVAGTIIYMEPLSHLFTLPKWRGEIESLSVSIVAILDGRNQSHLHDISPCARLIVIQSERTKSLDVNVDTNHIGRVD